MDGRRREYVLEVMQFSAGLKKEPASHEVSIVAVKHVEGSGIKHSTINSKNSLFGSDSEVWAPNCSSMSFLRSQFLQFLPSFAHHQQIEVVDVAGRHHMWHLPEPGRCLLVEDWT